jgi:hypothetical protein
MAKFAEAPQDTMNAIVILSAFVFVALSVSAHPLGSKIRATPARQPL